MAPQRRHGTVLDGAALDPVSCTKDCSEWGKAEPTADHCEGAAQDRRLTLEEPMEAPLLREVPQSVVAVVLDRTDANATPLRCLRGYLVPTR